MVKNVQPTSAHETEWGPILEGLHGRLAGLDIETSATAESLVDAPSSRWTALTPTTSVVPGSVADVSTVIADTLEESDMHERQQLFVSIETSQDGSQAKTFVDTRRQNPNVSSKIAFVPTGFDIRSMVQDQLRSDMGRRVEGFGVDVKVVSDTLDTVYYKTYLQAVKLGTLSRDDSSHVTEVDGTVALTFKVPAPRMTPDWYKQLSTDKPDWVLNGLHPNYNGLPYTLVELDSGLPSDVDLYKAPIVNDELGPKYGSMRDFDWPNENHAFALSESRCDPQVLLRVNFPKVCEAAVQTEKGWLGSGHADGVNGGSASLIYSKADVEVSLYLGKVDTELSPDSQRSLVFRPRVAGSDSADQASSEMEGSGGSAHDAAPANSAGETAEAGNREEDVFALFTNG